MAPDETPPPPPQGRTRGRTVACIDFVEDRMRSRTVAVFVGLAMYLVMGAELMKVNKTTVYETVARVTISSRLPALSEIGPGGISTRPTSVMVISSEGKSFVTKTCPSVNESVRISVEQHEVSHSKLTPCVCARCAFV